MHIHKDYKHYRDPANKRRHALLDIERFLGKARYEEISANMRAGAPSYDWFIGACAVLLGIEGYPVRAWAEELGINLEDETVH